ncbi:MAG: transcriptional repressor [Tissierellia bacterium]|nr:transcriptional repressor [Tissierellia bacterium]
MTDKFKMTKKRRLVYEVLENAIRPLTASEIFDCLKEDENEVWLSTIYRTLQVLEKADLISKTIIPGSEKAHYLTTEEKHKHYGICLNCHKLIDLECPIDRYKKILDGKGFTIVDHRFMIYGYCKECS